MPPDWNAYVRRNLPELGLSPERENEIAAELADQFEQAWQEALRAGLGEAEAADRARSHVRDWAALAAELRAAERPAEPPLAPEPKGPVLAGLGHDVRYACRTLRRNPVFAGIAMVTLAFGIGGNTAVFTVVDHVALRSLPYPHPERLMEIDHTRPDQPEVDPWTAIDNLLDFRQRTRAFESIAGISPVWSNVLTGAGEPERLETLYASAALFPMLGVQPAIGRLFTPEDDNRAQPRQVAVLSYGFWQRRFGGSRGVPGKTLRLDGSAVTVVGVLPQDFRWRGDPLAGTATAIDLWMPLAANQLARSPRTLRFLKVVGRLRRGVTSAQGREEVRRIGGQLTAEYPDANGNLSFAGVALEAKLAARLRPAVYLLLATVGFVLLMASANVANLLLARAESRRREIAVRLSMGASATRLLRQLLTESAVLTVAGGALGFALALVLVRLILAYGPPALVQTVPISLDGRALLFTSAIAIVTAVLAGLVPAWRAISGSPAAVLREGRNITAGNRAVRWALATAQVTIALALLIGSGLLIRSFLRVLAVDPGFEPRNVASVSTQVPDGAGRLNVYHTVRDRLLATPGVRSVGAVSRLPMLGQNLASLLYIEGQDTAGHPPEVEFRAATASYFPTMGIPLRAGRLFDERDPANLPVLLIDEITARRYFPANPVGRRIRFLADGNGPWYTVIGVVGATRHFGLEADPRPTIYRRAELNPLGAPIFVVRTAGDPGPMLQTLARVVRTAYGNMPAYNVFAMEQLVARSTAERRFLMWLLTAFAVAALLLAGIGIYGAISHSVAERTHEIGVRMALGAAPGDVLRLVFHEGLRIAGVGIVLGVGLGWAAAMLGRKLLFGVRPNDLPVFAAATGTLILFAALACYAPARRAARVDPLVTLRED
ncbi:MAG: ABC transporter permease [Acidobacteriia bacterium]|nr:ABC transporter permease [Terriglobia bacterium]